MAYSRFSVCPSTGHCLTQHSSNVEALADTGTMNAYAKRVSRPSFGQSNTPATRMVPSRVRNALPTASPKSLATSRGTHTPDTSALALPAISRIIPGVTSYDEMSLPGVASGTTCLPARIAPAKVPVIPSPASDNRSHAVPSTVPPTMALTSA